MTKRRDEYVRGWHDALHALVSQKVANVVVKSDGIVFARAWLFTDTEIDNLSRGIPAEVQPVTKRRKRRA